MSLFGSKFIFSTDRPQRFSWRPVVNSPIFFCFRFADIKTDVFNFTYLNSTRLQLLISTNRQDYPLCVFCWFNLRCDYNRNARKNFNVSYNILSTIFWTCDVTLCIAVIQHIPISRGSCVLLAILNCPSTIFDLRQRD